MMTRPIDPTESRLRVLRIGAVVAVLAVIVLFILPIRPPQSENRVIPLSPQYGKAKSILIGSKGGLRRGSFLSYLPRTVSIQTNGPGVKVYLMDLSAVKKADRIAAFRKAAEEAESGIVPAAISVIRTITNTSRERLNLSAWPARSWPAQGWEARYLLILYSDAETEATVQISYS